MSIRLGFEIGHKATKKDKTTKEGFTHDWELFIRGEDGTEMVHFTEKVVFILHDSFTKPKRAVKEPPYQIKEQGYAAFIVQIEIHLKNREEPKRIVFDYDLDLQPMKGQLKEFIVQSQSDEFRRKCIKGGGVLLSDYKSRDPHHKPTSSSSAGGAIRKPTKRPDELIVKPGDKFQELFGQPLSRAHQNPSPIPSKGSNSSKSASATTSSVKEKLSTSVDKPPKHKHSPSKESKQDQSKKLSQDSDKAKKDKVKDRERSDKKDKTAKRPSSPSPSSSMSSTSARNNNAIVPSTSSAKIEPKPPKASKSNTSSSTTTTAISTTDPAFVKKSNKKDKKTEKDRERSDKKDPRKFESPPKAKERESLSTVKEEKKVKSSPGEPKIHTAVENDKRQQQQRDKEAERKHKHKKKARSKDKEVERDVKKDKGKNSTAYQAKPVKEVIKSQTLLSEIESDVESPPSIKQESENSNSDSIPQKPPVVENKKPEKRSKSDNKEEKLRKRKAAKEQRDSSSSPPSKNVKLDSDKSNTDSNLLNNNIDDGSVKMSIEYISELKELKQKINGLKSNDEIQHVVKIIASTGCYEITKSSFDFDLVQLDRTTVQSLLEMFKLKK